MTKKCPLQRGVCRDAVSVCTDGRFAPCSYGPQFQPVETAKDGLDNDCDGLIDEESSDAGDTRVDGGQGTPDAGVPADGGESADGGEAGTVDAGGAPDAACPMTFGVCANATQTLGDGGSWACDYGPEYEVSETRCDGLDNDCDGLVDLFPDGGPLTVACPLSDGVCAGARSTCTGGAFPECIYGPDFQPAETRCDGRDNDCDGLVDLFPDGGPLVAACPLSLGVCAGVTTACTAGAFPACRYGAAFEATESRCDGLDNDCDGVADGALDGGPLTVSCPLTRGVCVGASAKCIGGVFAACEYGADYEELETRCDGLDNDCDGRVDKSWRRVLVESDAGLFRPPQLDLYDFFLATTTRDRDGGFIVVTANQALWIDSSLRPTRRVALPQLPPGHAVEAARPFPWKDHWMVLAWSNIFNTEQCLIALELNNDGSFPRLADGGVSLFAQTCMNASGESFPAFRGGPGLDLSALLAVRPVFDQAVLWGVTFLPDGGVTTATMDAGVDTFFMSSRVDSSSAGFVARRTTNTGTVFRTCDTALQSCPIVLTTGPYCSLARPDPFDVVCPDAVRFSDGGIATLPSGFSVSWNGLRDDGHIFMSQSLDGGRLSAADPDNLMTIDTGELRFVETLPRGASSEAGLTATPVSGPLYLLTFPETAAQPPGPISVGGSSSTIDAFEAEYVCMP